MNMGKGIYTLKIITLDGFETESVILKGLSYLNATLSAIRALEVYDRILSVEIIAE